MSQRSAGSCTRSNEFPDVKLSFCEKLVNQINFCALEVLTWYMNGTFSSFFWNKACSHWSLCGRSISRDVSNTNPAIFKLERNSQLCGKPSTSLHFSWLDGRVFSVQVNLCQKLLFLHQLTHNMTTDCSLIVQYVKIARSEHVVSTNCFLFWHSEQFIYTACS